MFFITSVHTYNTAGLVCVYTVLQFYSARLLCIVQYQLCHFVVQSTVFYLMILFQIMTSGWVIEPYRKDEKLCTQVTYSLQVRLEQKLILRISVLNETQAHT